MDKYDIKDLKEEIKEAQKVNVEQLIFMLKKCLIAYIKSYMTFGLNSCVTKDVNNVTKEIWNIHKEEKYLLDFIVSKSNLIDFYEVCLLLDKLDQLNENTVMYYLKVLEDIIDASNLNQELRANRDKKNFDTLIDTTEYKIETYGLILSFDDIKKFFNYEEEFWNYVESRIMWIDTTKDETFKNFEVIMKFDNDNCFEDMRIVVPNIINLRTALINVHEFKHAYDLYINLNKPLEKSDREYEACAKECEEQFKKEYVLKNNGFKRKW